MARDELQAMSIMIPKYQYHWLRIKAFREATSMSRLIAYAVSEQMDQDDGEVQPCQSPAQ